VRSALAHQVVFVKCCKIGHDYSDWLIDVWVIKTEFVLIQAKGDYRVGSQAAPSAGRKARLNMFLRSTLALRSWKSEGTCPLG
jgi:hypothetical protein